MIKSIKAVFHKEGFKLAIYEHAVRMTDHIQFIVV